MEELLQVGLQYGLFLAKTLTIVIAVVFVLVMVANLRRHLKEHADEHLDIKHLNKRYEHMAEALNHELLNADQQKARAKEQKAEAKQRKKAAKLGKTEDRNRTFVIDFDGDIRASAVDHLREEISAVLQVAKPEDEVLIRLESPGGMVHGYGLAASQMRRIRDAGIKLTASVDKVAASGGYMMACVADQIIAAPFAVIGSIGVVAQLPNFNRLLKEKNIDFELHTAGEYKRTLTLFGENTDEARDKFQHELEETHSLFKQFVSENRPQVNIDEVATGEHWYATQAVDKQLVDELKTSDDYLLQASRNRELYSVKFKVHKTLQEKVMGGMGRIADDIILRLQNRI
ncbi:MAG: protease SohB [Nevskiales bacterium]